MVRGAVRGAFAAVIRAGVANEDGALFHGVLAVHSAGIDAVLVVDAVADCVTFDNADAHCGLLRELWFRRAVDA